MSTPLPPSELYAGKYRLLREIGKGGMGSVFEANEVALDRVVAVKRLTAEIGGTLEARQRFRRELKAAARLSHAGIAQVLGYGTADDGQYYIAMELVSGEPLRRELDRAASVRELLALFDQILGVLAYAHARGVVHRDLKPENIMVARVGAAPVCKLLDFGVARTDGDRNPASTVPASVVPSRILGGNTPVEGFEVVGTPGYMAPEQVRGERAGPAADLYAVGVMLFEALTGTRPIQGRGDEVMARKLLEPSPAVCMSRFGEVSVLLAELVAHLLERDPALRLSVAADARAALAKCPDATALAGVPGGARGVTPSDPLTRTVRVVDPHKGSAGAAVLPFVGRRVELRRLDDAFRHVGSGAARLVLIEGPEGIGKSHLVDCFVQRVVERGGCTVLGGSYVEAGGPEGDGIRTALERHIGSWGKGREAVGRLVSRYLDRHGGADVDEALSLTDWLRPSAAGARGTQQEGRLSHTIALVERILRRIAMGRPLLLTLDDLQWGGRGAFDTLSFFLAMWRQAPAPVLVVATLLSPIEDRDLLQVYRKLMVHGGDQVQRIPLEPLSLEDSAKVITAVVGDRAISQAASIAERAAGNPLFAIQLARLAHASAEAISERGPRSVADGNPESQLPASVQELLEARLDAAISRAKDSDTASRVLSGIALLLPPTPTMLVELALIDSGISAQSVRAALDQLVEMGIVRERLLEGVEAIDFEHPLLGEVLRARISPRAVRRQSAAALALKEAHYGPAKTRIVHQLAEHARLAGLSDRARELGLLAARQALDAGRQGEAMGLLSRLMDDEAREPGAPNPELALLVSRVADETGDLQLSESLLVALLRGEDQGALLATLALARQKARIGRLAEAVAATERAEAITAILKARGEPIGEGAEVETLRLRASIARREGRFEEAIASLEQALSRDPHAPADRARLLFDNLAWARHRAGDKTGALVAARRALDLSTPGLDRGWALRSVAVIGGESLAMAERRQKLEQALSIARERGALRLLASALTHLGNLERAAGDTQALSHFRQVLQIGPDYVDDEDLSESLASLSMMLLENGEAQEAAEHLQRRERRRSSWENALRVVTAAVASARGDIELAIAEAVALREAAREIPSSWGVARAAEQLATTFTEANRHDLAAWAQSVAASAWVRAGLPDTSLGTKPPENTEPTLENTS